MLLSVAIIALTGCAGALSFSTADEIRSEVYVHHGPASLTLFTFVNDALGVAWHSGLMINGSHRVLYDPGAIWRAQGRNRHHDVRYGFDDEYLQAYLDRVAGTSRHVVMQSIEVPREVADQAIAAAFARPPVIMGECTYSVAELLRGLPGFDGLAGAHFPARLMRAFGEIPDVQTARYSAPQRLPSTGTDIFRPQTACDVSSRP